MRTGIQDAFDAVARCAGGVLLGKRYGAALRTMAESQWLGPASVRERWNAALPALLRHAAETVPYYRAYFDERGVRAGDLRSLADLARFPILTKAAHRDAGRDAFVSCALPEHRRLTERTSGSTGEPFEFYLDRSAIPGLVANHAFADRWFGIGLFDRSVRIGGRRSSAPQPPLPFCVRVRCGAMSWLRNRYENATQLKIPAWDVTPESVQRLHGQIERFRPSYLVGYGSALAALADYMLAANLRFTFRIRGVVVEAEPTTPVRHSVLTRCFEAPIGNRYGPRELGGYNALSCPREPSVFHVNPEAAVWETVREDGSPAGPGETGRVLLTDLNNYVMPFVRWDTGDVVTLGDGPCACGRGWPVVKCIVGRSFEVVRTPAGRVISPAALTNFLFVSRSNGEFVREYQLVQDGQASARLRIAVNSNYSEQRHSSLQQDLQRWMGPDMTAVVEVVRKIACEPSGKRPLVVPYRANGAPEWPAESTEAQSTGTALKEDDAGGARRDLQVASAGQQ